MTDIIVALVACAVLAIAALWSRQGVVDRATAAGRVRDAVNRRPDDTPPVLKAKTWIGARR